jgi:hypothetical protein
MHRSLTFTVTSTDHMNTLPQGEHITTVISLVCLNFGLFSLHTHARARTHTHTLFCLIRIFLYGASCEIPFAFLYISTSGVIQLFSFRLHMSSAHSVLLAYSRGLIRAWYCICSDYIQLTYFSISSKTISSRIFFLFTFYLEVYNEMFLFLLLVLLFLVILGIISHIFALFVCLTMIIPRHYPKFYFTEDVLSIFKSSKAVFIFDMSPPPPLIYQNPSMQTFYLFNSIRTVCSLCSPCRLNCSFHNPSTRSRLTKQIHVKYYSDHMY